MSEEKDNAKEENVDIQDVLTKLFINNDVGNMSPADILSNPYLRNLLLNMKKAYDEKTNTLYLKFYDVSKEEKSKVKTLKYGQNITVEFLEPSTPVMVTISHINDFLQSPEGQQLIGNISPELAQFVMSMLL
ncbi:MAG: hypothetical protein QXU98_10220 [Candidatus Parvarchaeota archaeon]